LRFARNWSKRGALVMSDGSPIPTTMPWRSIVGTVGPASADQARQYGPYYRAGDVVGQSGLQATAEQVLAGTPEGELQIVAGGRVVQVLQSYPDKPGADVHTTFDPHLIAAALAVLGEEGNGAAMVVIQPSTGA